jgi:hypothetical protein
MKTSCVLSLFWLLALRRWPPPDEKAPKAQYDEKGQLIRPADYHEWMFLSAGYGESQLLLLLINALPESSRVHSGCIVGNPSAISKIRLDTDIIIDR